MSNILIVDDEDWIRESLRSKLKRSGLPIENVLESANTDQALEILTHTPVDIMLCDIRMCGTDGLSLCAEVAKRFPAVQKIIISGYSEFDYAVRAIQNGVAAYLLKPIDNGTLYEAVKNCLDRLKLESKSGFAAIREAIYENSDMPEQKLSSPTQINSLIRAYTLKSRLAFICLYIGGKSTFSLDDTLSLMLRQMEKRIFGTDLFIFRGDPMEYIVLLCYQADAEEQAIHDDTLAIADRLADAFRKVGCYDASCGVESRNFIPSQAFFCARDLMRHRILLPEALSITPTMTAPFTQKFELNRKLEHRLKRALSHGNYHEVSSSLHELAAQLVDFSISYASLTNLYDTLQSLTSANASGRYHSSTLLWRYRSVRAMLDAIRERCITIINTTMAHQDNSKDQVVNRVRDFLDNHFDQHISLEEIANRFYISPTYLSALFKDKFGINFMEYLLDVRIQAAKRLLDTKRYKIKTVAEMTGFNDQHYFSRIFKRTVGVTPREFMQDNPQIKAR